jgi:5-methylcytosine-specific restriction endonuclease McrA
MSRLAPQSHDPVEIASRRRFTPKQRLQILLNGNGRCYVCKVKLADEWHAEHPIPHALGGSDKLEDLRPICLPCHSPKTKADVARIAKAKRQEKLRLDVERTVSPAWGKSRPFSEAVRIPARRGKR